MELQKGEGEFSYWEWDRCSPSLSFLAPTHNCNLPGSKQDRLRSITVHMRASQRISRYSHGVPTGKGITMKEPTRDQYQSEKAWRIARRRFLRKRQRQTEQYKQKLTELRNSGYSSQPPTNRPIQNEAPKVESVPWV